MYCVPEMTPMHSTYIYHCIVLYCGLGLIGLEFEDRIRVNEAGNTKFNFLKPNDPYHAYYRHKITEIQEGVAQEVAAAAAAQQSQVRHIHVHVI